MTRNKYFYIRQFVNQNDVICQYMNLDNLILILSTNKYFVRFKRGFSDKYEKTLPLKNLFPAYLANRPPDKTILEENISRISEKLASYKILGNIPASCWTLRNAESALMWSGYTSKFGVCIKSTVSKFISAIDYCGYDLICGAMAYRGYNYWQDDEAFSKDQAFADEKEFRFYFLPNNAPDKKDKEGIYFSINPQVLITEVILSPQMALEVSSALGDMIQDKYSITVRNSNIHLD